MNSSGISKVIVWAPRVLSLVFAFFISLFATDAFAQGYSAIESVVAFLIHLIPTYILIAFILLSWKKPFFGGLGFFLSGTMLALMIGNQSLAIHLLITFPNFIIGSLYLLSAKQLHQNQDDNRKPAK